MFTGETDVSLGTLLHVIVTLTLSLICERILYERILYNHTCMLLYTLLMQQQFINKKNSVLV